MRESILRLNAKRSKQYESSRFPYMELVPKIEGLFESSLYGNCVDAFTAI